MDWIMYATATILHVWCASFAVGFIYTARINPEAAGKMAGSVRFLAPFIGLVFFYSWVIWG